MTLTTSPGTLLRTRTAVVEFSTSSTSCVGGLPGSDERLQGDNVSQKESEIVELAGGTPRYRVLPNEHFEFRGGKGAVSIAVEGGLRDHPQVRLAREARLLPEYARIYPCLIPDVWELASLVTEKVAAWQLQRHKALLGSVGSLNPQHFEFRDASRPARWLSRQAGFDNRSDRAQN